VAKNDTENLGDTMSEGTIKKRTVSVLVIAVIDVVYFFSSKHNLRNERIHGEGEVLECAVAKCNDGIKENR